MKVFLLIIESLTAAALIFAILLHSPKGDGMGGIGGHARMFSHHRDMEAGLNKVTYVLATIFVVTATILGLFF